MKQTDGLASPPALALWPFAALLALLAGVNAPVLTGLFRTWWVSYSEMGHGFIALPLALYIAWEDRAKLKDLAIAGNPLGLAVVTVSAAVVLVSNYAQWIFFSQIAFWLILLGAIWYTLGAAWIKALRFPLFLLFLTVPPPAFLYTRITFEMQLLASRLAETGLELLGYSILREGNILQMVGERLSVAEACSGIRSLVTLLFFVIVYGYFMVPRPLARWLLVAAAVPIAVLANAVRIVATGVLSQYNRELAHGITHEVSGYITLFAGGLACILLEKSLRGRWEAKS